MYDIWFISYREPNAEENWLRVKSLLSSAQRLSNITGLVRAYKTAARRSRTEWFWIIDGDNWILDQKIFQFRCPHEADTRHLLFVWPSRNSINGLSYGNGAIKLYNRSAALVVPDNVEDFSLAVAPRRVKFRKIASETRINRSPLQAWVSGFREGFKLHRRILNGETNAIKQFQIWSTVGTEVVNGTYAIEGAKLGYKKFVKNPDFPINNHDLLKSIFDRSRKQKISITVHPVCKKAQSATPNPLF
jgi:hypothetical protein